MTRVRRNVSYEHYPPFTKCFQVVLLRFVKQGACLEKDEPFPKCSRKQVFCEIS